MRRPITSAVPAPAGSAATAPGWPLGRPDPRWLLLIFLMALAARVGWILLSPVTPASDAAYYDQAARDLAAGKGYLMGGRPTAYWPVGFPAFLAGVYWLVGYSVAAAQVCQALLGASTAVLAAMLGARVFGPAAGHLAGLLLAVSPNDASYAAVLLSEPLFTTLLVAALLLLLPSGLSSGYLAAGDLARHAAAGVLLGLAAHVRPVVLLLPIALGAWRWWQGGRVPRALGLYAVVLIAMGLTLSPWVARNWTVLGHPVVVSTNGGVNMWIGNNPRATGKYETLPGTGLRGTGLGEVERDRAGYREAAAFIREHPGRYLWLSLRRVGHLFARGWDGVYENLRGVEPPVSTTSRVMLYGLAQVHYGLLMLAALAGMAWLGGLRGGGGLLLTVALYWLAVHMAIMAEPRYRFPLMPILAAFAGAFLASRLPLRLGATAGSATPEAARPRAARGGERPGEATAAHVRSQRGD